MSTTLVAAAAANAAASAAEAAARRAECRVVLNGYDAKTATVKDAREYAACVYTIHGSGEPLSATAALIIKLAIILALLGGAIGAYVGWEEDGIVGAGLLGMGGVLIGPLALVVVLAVGAGVAFLFT